MNLNQPGARSATQLLEEIALIANRTDKLCRFAGTDDIDDAEALIGTLRDAITRIGWLADRGIAGAQIVGGADDWMLPPVVAAIARMEQAGVEAH